MSRRTPIAAANWKMHKTGEEARAFVQALDLGALSALNGVTVICPAFNALEAVGSGLKSSGVRLGAQNCHFETKGAFTGEVAPAQLKAAGCAYVIVGHSERRHLFGETDELVNRKARACLEAGLTPIVCVGETLEEREGGKTEPVVGRQVAGSLAGVTREQAGNLVLAYEPVWAIGTGKTATPEQVQEVHAFIRRALKEILEAGAEAVPILYGGSVKPDNAARIMAGADVDGALVGGASLDPASFSAIARAVAG